MSDIPNNAPITITLAPEVAAALMVVTSAYAAALSWERRLDYAIAELAQWQVIHAAISQGREDSALVSTAHRAQENIVQLIENSIREGLND